MPAEALAQEWILRLRFASRRMTFPCATRSRGMTGSMRLESRHDSPRAQSRIGSAAPTAHSSSPAFFFAAAFLAGGALAARGSNSKFTLPSFLS